MLSHLFIISFQNGCHLKSLFAVSVFRFVSFFDMEKKTLRLFVMQPRKQYTIHVCEMVQIVVNHMFLHIHAISASGNVFFNRTGAYTVTAANVEHLKPCVLDMYILTISLETCT